MVEILRQPEDDPRCSLIADLKTEVEAPNTEEFLGMLKKSNPESYENLLKYNRALYPHTTNDDEVMAIIKVVPMYKICNPKSWRKDRSRALDMNGNTVSYTTQEFANITSSNYDFIGYGIDTSQSIISYKSDPYDIFPAIEN